MSIVIAKTTKIILTTITNIFTSESRSMEIEYKNDITLQTICNKYLPEGDWFIGLNGKVFPEVDWTTTKVFPGEQVIFTPNLGGPALALIWTVATSEVFLTFLIKAAITYGLGQLAKSLAPEPDFNPTTFQQHNMVSTQFYGWNPSTLQQPGVPIPKFFGDNTLFGNVVHSWTEPTADGLAQTIHAIIAYGRGPVQGITSSDLGKNIFFQQNQPAQNFEGVQIEERYGTSHQTEISLFSSDGVKLEYRPKIVVTNATPRTYIIRNNDYDGLDIEIAFPSGLYFVSGNSIVNHSVGVKIEIAEDGSENWSTLVNKTVSSAVQSQYIIAFNNTESYTGGGPVDIARGTAYKVKVTKTTGDKSSTLYGDTLQLNSIRSIYTDGFTYPGIALLGVIVEATDQLSGSFQCSIKQEGKLCEVYTDATTKSIIYTIDPAWILYNVITNPTITGGRSGQKIDYAESLEDGLVGHWKMDDNTDTRDLVDSSDSGNNGTLYSALTSTVSVPGDIGRAIDFGGIHYGAVEDNDEYQFTSKDFSIAVRVKFNSNYTDQGFHAFMGRTDTSSLAHQWAFGYFQAIGSLSFITEKARIIDIPWTPVAGVWYNIVFVRAGTSCIFYVDKVVVGSSQMEEISEPNNRFLYIGYGEKIDVLGGWSSRLYGCLDDVRLYNRDLGDLEIEALYEKVSELPPEDWEENDLPLEIRSYRGLHPSKVDLDSFLDFSNYATEIIKNPLSIGGTEERRFTFNGGFDNHSNRWETMKKICESANAAPLWNGNTLSIALENPRELTQIFNIGNIQKSVFRVFFLNQIDRASEVVVEYKKDYDRSQIAVVDTTLEFKGSTSIERMFCNSESMAWRYAAEQVLRNRNVKVGLEFEVNTQAIMCRVGDRIRVAHPVFTKDVQCGGSIIQVIGNNTIQIDTSEEDVPALSPTSKIAIRSFNTEGQERIEVYNVITSKSNMVIIEGVWDTTPEIGDLFILGDTASFSQDYEILTTTKVSDLMVKLTCQQYYEFREHELDSLL